MSTVVSVRIRREVKELLDKEGIDISEAVRNYLEELAYRIKLKHYISKWDMLLKSIKPSEKGFSSRSVREDRESH